MKKFVAAAHSLLACLALTLCVPASAQQPYPQRLIRIVAPFPSGGQTDLLSRLLAQHLSEKLGQQVIVDNRPGGNSAIGTEIVARAKPDGYTLLLAGNTHVIAPLLQTVPYDPIKDFSPVATLIDAPLVLVSNPDMPATVRELVALAKSRPGKLNYASYGSGSPSHLGAEMFSTITGIRMQHIPYKGAAPAVTDLLGRQVDLFLAPISSVVPHIKAGKLKGLAVGAASRVSLLPDVPTFAEAGVANFEPKTWLGVFAPAGTPRPVVEKLAGEISALLKTPEFRQTLGKQGMDPSFRDPAQFAALLESDMAKNAKVIESANIKLE